MKKLLSVFVVCLAMVLSLSGCGTDETTGGTSGEGSADQTLVMVTSTEPQSFNPDFKSDDGAWPIKQNIFNR